VPDGLLPFAVRAPGGWMRAVADLDLSAPYPSPAGARAHPGGRPRPARTGVDDARVLSAGSSTSQLRLLPGPASGQMLQRRCAAMRSDVCKTLTQSLTREHFGHQAPTLSKEKTRRFQRVYPIAGAGFEPATFGL
jgi:hypothetical protein